MFPAYLHDSLSDQKDRFEKEMPEKDREELVRQDFDIQDQRMNIDQQSVV